MAQRTFTVGIPEELERRVVEAARRADMTRNAFVRRALEAALGVGSGDASSVTSPRGSEVHQESSAGTSASPRAPASVNFGSHERYGPRKPRPKGS